MEDILKEALNNDELRQSMLEDGFALPEELEERLSLWYIIGGSGWVLVCK